MKQKQLFLLAVCAAMGLLVFAFASHARFVSALSSCPCHIFPSGSTPTSPTVANDASPISLGTRFTPAVDGYITGVRFYKDATMTDTHTGSLWSAGGSLLASGTYVNETASGWQDVVFSSPVHVTAATTYVASLYSPTGKYIAQAHYFDGATSNYPLSTPAGAGVYNYGGDVFPNNSFNNASYWVDATFRQNATNTAPTVSSTSPLSNATNAYASANITATLNQNVDSSTVSTSTVKLTDSSGTDIPVTVSYSDATKTITLAPASPLTHNTAYTVSIRGGTGGVTNLDGTTLASDYQWSFTTGADQCPCTVWNNGAPSSTPTTYVGTNGGEEFGQSMHADESGYIKAVRFYKPLKSTATSHAVHVWTQSGTLLATGISSNESNYGWQEVPLATSVPVTQGVNYVVSYYAPDNAYVYSLGALSTQAGSGPIHANASGSRYEPTNDVFPSLNDGNNATASYWIDAVFTITNNYTAPFNLAVSQPANNAYGTLTTTPLTFQLSNAVDTSTVAGSLNVKTANGSTVTGVTTYDDTTHTITFKPSQALAHGTAYVATLASTLKDTYGTALAPTTVSFTTGSTLSTNINQGMGGPVLVLTSAANPYDTYLAEMLRAEGITYFDVKDISQLTSATLANYSMVLLGKSALTGAQVSTLTSWVQTGGNLIAMQPDKKLAPLLGLTDQSTTLSEGYLRVDTSQAPGTGVTAQTMQYHYAADVYTPGSDTQTIATLFSDATTPTSNPAVSERAAGSGHAAAFMYDLPKSIALTHQGNPAWAGQERDANSPIRPDDLFDGNGSTDWLNLSKAYIPQADEQQRLLVNMMTTMSQPETPLPSFWILPHGYKSALIMTEDDHATATTTFDIFDDMVNNSPTNCSVTDWGCRRSGSLLYTASGLTSAQANTAYALGFSMGNHIQTNCGNYTSYSDLDSNYVAQLAAFQAKYTGLPAQRTTRTHCYVWSDWDSTPKDDIAHGIHMNFNYEWYPNTWTGSNTGYLTGSGLTMRFTDASGALLDDYQGVTDLDYETDPTNASVNSMLDNTINANEFYGVLGTHYDSTSSYYQLLMASAMARNIPMINADQMLTWKNALGSSNFTNITSTKYSLGFTVQVGEGGQGMQAMVPTSTSNGALTDIKAGATEVTYTTSTIKGTEYAIFNASPGAYIATYGTQPSTGGSSGSTSSGSTGTGGAAAPTKKASATQPYVSVTNPTPFTAPATPDTKPPVATPHTTTDTLNYTAKQPTHSDSPSAFQTFWKVTAYVTSALLGLIVIIGIYMFIRRRREQS